MCVFIYLVIINPQFKSFFHTIQLNNKLCNHTNIIINKNIVNYLRKKYPKYGIISEELPEIRSKSEYNWIIDPLDGSRNFVNKIPFFSISIALKKYRETIAGFIYDPIQNNFYYAFKDGKDARQFVTWKKDTKQLIMGIGHKVKSSKNPDSRVEILKKYVLENLGSNSVSVIFQDNYYKKREDQTRDQNGNYWSAIQLKCNITLFYENIFEALPKISESPEEPSFLLRSCCLPVLRKSL